MLKCKALLKLWMTNKLLIYLKLLLTRNGQIRTQRAIPAIQEEGKNLVRKGNCTRCHGSELEGTYNIPRLAGQRSQYLKTTLLQYKNKERNNFPPMSSMLNRYSEEEIGVMAEYIAGLAYQD